MRLRYYLEKNGIRYDTVEHLATASSSRSAQASHISGDHVAKAVLLCDKDGRYLVAVLPASRRLELGELWRWLHQPVGLATEDEVACLFDDCERGALPALGGAYGIPVLVDDSLSHRPDIYIEGGDHRCLVHMRGEDFDRLMAQEQHHRFAQHA
jgi:Ala-tRNA(Pro) deacylase